MRNYLIDYLQRFGFERQTTEYLTSVFDAIDREYFIKVQTLYSERYKLDCNALDEIILQISLNIGVDKRVVNLVVVICLFKILEERLTEKGIPKEIIEQTLIDVVYKHKECVTVFGIHGVMEASWFKAILEERCFGIGRLQFEIDEFRLNEYSNGKNVVRKGEKVLSIHIPGSNQPFTESACKHTYKSAVDFFRKYYKSTFNGAIPFVSWTWLLYPKNSEFMGESSNILRFQKDFDVIESAEYKKNDSIVWRIFGVPEIKEISNLPENTSLQKSAKEYLLKGKNFGWGYGVFFID